LRVRTRGVLQGQRSEAPMDDQKSHKRRREREKELLRAAGQYLALAGWTARRSFSLLATLMVLELKELFWRAGTDG